MATRVAGQDTGCPQLSAITTSQNMLASEPRSHTHACDLAYLKPVSECELLKVGEGELGAQIRVMRNKLDQGVSFQPWNNKPTLAILPFGEMFNASFHALPFNPEQNCRLVKGNHQPCLL